jgi:nucleotide-binding universal stress UspA family protein
MLNILVPTDFSDLSKVAIQYAMRMANKMDGSVTLLHVISNIVKPTTARIEARAKVLERELLQVAKEEISELATLATKQHKSKRPVLSKVLMGESFNDILKRLANKSNSDIIVKGTKGASGLKKLVVGSKSATVIEKYDVPVLVIPENANFKSLKNLVLATDLKFFEDELKKMMPLLKAFNPTLHVFHIVPNEKEIDSLGKKVKGTLKKYDYRKSTITIHVGKNIPAAIDSFIGDSNNDILAMFSHDYDTFDQVFNRSMTKRMAFQSSVPLLAFKRK